MPYCRVKCRVKIGWNWASTNHIWSISMAVWHFPMAVCKIILTTLVFIFCSIYYRSDQTIQPSAPFIFISNHYPVAFRLFQAYFCWFYFCIWYASLVGSFDFVHRLFVCWFVCFPFQFLYGWCLCRVLQYCVCVKFIDAYLVQIPRTLSVTWYKCRLPSFMPSKMYMPSKMPSCRVLCQVKIRALKIMGIRQNPNSSRM